MAQARGKKKSILVVEDELSLLQAIEAMLEDEGFDVDIAAHAEEATSKLFLLKNKPDCIWLDLNLPHQNGMEFLREIKADKDFKAIPIIVVSNFDDHKTIEEAKKLGIKEYFVKSNAELAAIVKYIKNLLRH